MMTVVCEHPGFRVDRNEHRGTQIAWTAFVAFETDESGHPKDSVPVTVYHPRAEVEGGQPFYLAARVGFPNQIVRPGLARALAEAIHLAADEADELNYQCAREAAGAMFEGVVEGDADFRERLAMVRQELEAS